MPIQPYVPPISVNVDKGIKRRDPISSVTQFQTQTIPGSSYNITPSRYSPVDVSSYTVQHASPRIAALQSRIGQHRDWARNIDSYLQIAAQKRSQVGSGGPQQYGSVGSDVSGEPSTYRGPGGGTPEQQLARQIASQTGGTRNAILNTAIDMFGTPYAWGGGGIGNRGSRGTGKGTQNVIGVDCSGLTSYVYGQFGIKLPRYSNHQTTVGVRTSIQNAKPGDLVGWAKGGHVAIYLGNGYIIHSARPGTKVTMRKLFNGENVFAVSLNIPGGAAPRPNVTKASQQVQQPTSRGAANINQIDSFLRALRQHESGNRYDAINRSGVSTASGAYQYIDRTWNNYGGYRRAYQAPQHIQDQRARQDIMNLFKKYGNWEQVAAHHFYPAWAGNKAYWNRKPTSRGNPTVAQYVASVLRHMR